MNFKNFWIHFLTNIEVGVYSFENQAVALKVVLVFRSMHDIFMNVSSCSHVLIWETSRLAAVDLEKVDQCSCPLPVLVSLSLQVGSYWVSNPAAFNRQEEPWHIKARYCFPLFLLINRQQGWRCTKIDVHNSNKEKNKIHGNYKKAVIF